MRVAVLVDRIKTIRTIRKAFRSAGDPPATARLLFLSSWQELVDGAGSKSFDLAIVQPSFGVAPSSSSPNLTDLERFVSLFPASSVILYVCRPDPAPSFLLDLARMGFPYLLLRGIDDDPRTVQRAVARAETRRALRLKLTALEDQLEGEAVGLLLDTATGWPPARRVEDLAKQQQMSRRTFQRRLRRGHLPTPGRLLSYSRFLEICTLWRSMGIQDRFRIASILALGDPASIGHLSRTLTGHPLGHFLDLDSGIDPGIDPLDWFLEELTG